MENTQNKPASQAIAEMPGAPDPAMRKIEKRLSQMSPFEIKNDLINYARKATRHGVDTLLNAGRGNPNWIATLPRRAFFALGEFAVCESERVMSLPEWHIAGMPEEEGIALRFMDYLKSIRTHQPEVSRFLKEAYDYCVDQGADPDSLVHEWADGIIGDEYPMPDRILSHTQDIIRRYLDKEMCDSRPQAKFDLFATEGGTAAMCYLFNTLQLNGLVKKGDKIALMTPIFTPYLEIPELAQFDLEVVNIKATEKTPDGLHTWQYPDSELEKLKDPSIKLLCLVNPSNPPSYALDVDTHHRLAEVIRKHNPDLMIITDDVYGTFVPHFHSLMEELPYNTACVYSFSKYFGATGWRLAVIATAEVNVFDHLLQNLPEEEYDALTRRYATITLDPGKLKFIDRLVADSRLVALNHTAGLSTPQQIQMSLFALQSLLDKEDRYKDKMMAIINERLEKMWENTGFELLPDPLRAGYYSEIDLSVWARRLYGDEFFTWMKRNYEPLDFVVRLAKETGVVLLNGSGFDGPAWSVRASLANLTADDYAQIGTHIANILEDYANIWKVHKEAEKAATKAEEAEKEAEEAEKEDKGEEK